MKIAVVGAGLAGFSVSNFLLDVEGVEVTLFDAKGPGAGGSGVSTGLMHPFAGRRALRSWRASEGMEASWNLIAQAEKALGLPVASRGGILRLALSERQELDFQMRAQVDSDAVWCDREQVALKAPLAVCAPGLWIPNAGTVYARRYMEGLLCLGLSKGLKFEQREIQSTEELRDFDQIVLCTGYNTSLFAKCSHLQLEPTKGHALRCRWSGTPLAFSLIGNGHISLSEDRDFCYLGSTYEHGFDHLSPNVGQVEQMMQKICGFYPEASRFEVVDVLVGARTSILHGYRPVVQQISKKTWVFTGLGSRGLLYHALLGRELAIEMAQRVGSLTCCPPA